MYLLGDNSADCQGPHCDEWLTGRQTRFCSARCRTAAYRAEGRAADPMPTKVCRLCGADFTPLRGKQTYCDFEGQASAACCEMQSALFTQRLDGQSARWDATCAREGCDDNAGWDGVGRPRRFCSPRCKTAHYRAEKRRKGASDGL